VILSEEVLMNFSMSTVATGGTVVVVVVVVATEVVEANVVEDWEVLFPLDEFTGVVSDEASVVDVGVVFGGAVVVLEVVVDGATVDVVEVVDEEVEVVDVVVVGAMVVVVEVVVVIGATVVVVVVVVVAPTPLDKLATDTGLLLLLVVPSPSCLWPFLPQHLTAPAEVRAHA
jgi:hypothetical protein